MSDLLKITATFAFILLLLRRKWNVGIVLISASAILAAAYYMPPVLLFKTVFHTLTSEVTFKLLIALTFIRMFEMILREKKVLQQMMNSMGMIINNKIGVIVSMPLLIGMLPSVGGAYFSAPMVDEATKGLGLSAEDKAFTNYWYRHPWELVLPLYPGLILASAITKIDIRDFIFLNLACSITMLVVGKIFGMKGVISSSHAKNRFAINGIWPFTPIVILLALVVLLNIELHYALVLMVLSLFIFFRYDLLSVKSVIKQGFSQDIIFLVFGVMLFKECLVSSGAVANLTLFFDTAGIPKFLVLFLLPFICGLLTGLTVGFVGASFPLILSLYGVDFHAFSFAFVSGYTGVLLSPVHVCLILTKDYFKANFRGIYRRIIPAVLIVFLISVVQYFFLSGKI